MSVISLYDTLTKTVKPLRLRKPGEVSMYVCGPTVYDHPHLGHARSAITYDVLRRYLEWRGMKVKHVSNVTDIDDKIISRAHVEGKTESEVAKKWERVYREAMNSLNVLTPHVNPRATEWVDEMVRFIEAIYQAGYAYATSSGVYLRVREVADYGELIGRSVDDLCASAQARVDSDNAKEYPLDFALWKAAKPGEPSWNSPWGAGRPGWHIECVAMSLALLGDGFDLHGGGDDLTFPHHTNEMAEAHAAGRAFATHWMHNAMLNVDGDKMSKSQDNFRTVHEMLQEHPGNSRAFRLLVLQTHYRKTMEVNAALMSSARSAVRKLDALARRVHMDMRVHAQMSERVAEAGFDASLNNSHVTCGSQLASGAVIRFQCAMENDMCTPEAVAVMFHTLRQANLQLDTGYGSPDSGLSDSKSGSATHVADAVFNMANVLGLMDNTTFSASDKSDDRLLYGQQSDRHQSAFGDEEVKQIVEKRKLARRMKDWSTSDALREELAAIGVVVEDTADGSTWYRK